MVCPPVRGDNPRALASRLSLVQADKLWYNYIIPPSSVQTLLSVNFFMLVFAFSGKGCVISNNLRPHNLLIPYVYKSLILA